MAEPRIDTLRALFAEDAVHVSDGGGLASATLHPLHGADRLARLYLQIARNVAGARYAFAELNGAPALFMSADGRALLDNSSHRRTNDGQGPMHNDGAAVTAKLGRANRILARVHVFPWLAEHQASTCRTPNLHAPS